MRKIGFVTPWYGNNIPGGAEAEARGVIKHLQAAGVELEVLTTCVKEFASDWYDNFYKPGDYNEDGVKVKRFLADQGDGVLFTSINLKLLDGQKITDKEEQEFLENIVNSKALYQYMEEHQDEYDLFVFIPYMFGTTYYGALTCLKKAILIPCFHDECYAYFKRFRRCFSQVNGMVFNAEPERTLANRLYYLKHTNQITMGIGLDTTITGDAERFRMKYNINDSFILYAGRKDETKNVHVLLTYFAQYKEEHKNQLKLVMIGPGKLPIPKPCEESVYDLGFVDIQDKYDAYAAASVLCQPSKNESFSFVIMESWLMERPVLVHSTCKVTANFVNEANGGLYFSDYYEFAEEIEYLLKNKDIANVLGKQGRKYVFENFTWDIITKKYIRFLESCIQDSE